MKLILTFTIITLSSTALLAQDKKAADSTSTKPPMQWVYHHDAADNTMRGYFLGTHKYPKNNLLQQGQVHRFQPTTDLFDIREK